MPDEPNVEAIATLRAGEPADRLRAIVGDDWEETDPPDFVFEETLCPGVHAQLTNDDRIGKIAFTSKFPSGYAFEGLCHGMSFDDMMRARPHLKYAIEHSPDEPKYSMLEYRETLQDDVELIARVRSGALIFIAYELFGATYREAGTWHPAPAGLYPTPEAVANAPFADGNLKLAVLGQLLDDKAIDLGEPAMLAMHVLGRYVDLEDEGYEPIEAARAYLERYPLTAGLLATITTLAIGAGSGIYRYVNYFWDGESDEFVVTSLQGIEACPNLRKLSLWMASTDLDLTPLETFAHPVEVEQN